MSISPSEISTAQTQYGYQGKITVGYVEQFYTRSAAPSLGRYFYGYPWIDHFYTISAAERSQVLGYGYTDEGSEGTLYSSAPAGGDTVPLLRLSRYLADTQDLMHWYTTSTQDQSNLISQGWTYDGIAGYIWPTPIVNTPSPNAAAVGAFIPTGTSDLVITASSVTDYQSYYCGGTVDLYIDGQAISPGTGFTYGLIPWSQWQYGCYAEFPGHGTYGTHVYRVEFSGYVAHLYGNVTDQWVFRGPAITQQTLSN